MTDERRALWWSDQNRPHDEACSRAQIDGLLRLLAPGPARVLDLGCGAGRVLEPLAAAGHELLGIDRNPDALAACRQRLAGTPAQLREGDFGDDAAFTGGPFDAVLCLGNTFMTVTEVDEAVDLMGRASTALGSRGWFAIDDCPVDFWPELTDGNWQGGLTETGDAQLVWHESDAVFALRHGESVDADAPGLEPADVRFRLWTDGALRLAARAAGLSAATRVETAHLLLFAPIADG